MNEGALSAEPTILERSPFLPPGWSPPQAAQAKPEPKQPVTGYEFRGVYQLGEAFRFLVSEPRSRNGRWVQLGEAYEDYEVRGYDVETETLTLFYNSKEEAIPLAKMDANPTPMAVSGQQAQPTAAEPRRVVRRTVRPARSRPGGESGESAAPPPPAWLQELREEAAERRAQAGGGAPGVPPAPDNFNTQGNFERPEGPPPELPQELLNIDIPPPPGPPPEPPPHIKEMMLQSRVEGPPGG